jgi:hypothetical protein
MSRVGLEHITPVCDWTETLRVHCDRLLHFFFFFFHIDSSKQKLYMLTTPTSSARHQIMRDKSIVRKLIMPDFSLLHLAS